MRILKNLDINKSIKTKRLVFEESWYDKFDTFTVYFLCLGLIWPSIFYFSRLESFLENKFEYFLLGILLLSGLYLLYCKFSEKKLKEIKFNIHKEEAKKRIIEYGKKYNYRISKISSNLILLNEPTNSFNLNDNEQTIWVFFKEDMILYTLIKEGYKTNFPVLFSQHFTKKDFIKILNQTNVQTKKSYFSFFFNELS
jgi:hypothetical protein